MTDKPVAAEELLGLSGTERSELLKRLSETELVRLAFELRLLCYGVWTTDPIGFAKMEGVLAEMAAVSTHFAIRAVHHWVSGLKWIVQGDFTAAIRDLGNSRKQFALNGAEMEASEVAVAMVYPLALSGEEEKALVIGSAALRVFLDHDARFSAAKIEHNLGNILHRRDRYSEAEAYFRSALTRFDRAEEPTKFVQISNSLANAIAHQARLDEAELIYEDALAFAKASDQGVLIAEIESNLGRLNVIRGSLDRAAYLFESSLQRYETLDLPLQTAVSELEIAESFIELNLFKEGSGILERLIPIFRSKGMHQELCSSLSHYAFSLLQSGQKEAAAKPLSELVVAAEMSDSSVLKGYAHLLRFRLLLDVGDLQLAAEALDKAHDHFADSGSAVRLAQVELAAGGLAVARGEFSAALEPLNRALSAAQKRSLKRLELDAHSAIGNAYLRLETLDKSEEHLVRAIELIETLRKPLAGEEFRLGFFTDKIRPFQDLIKLKLLKSTPQARESALLHSERARSRTLFEAMHESAAEGSQAFDPMARKREELALLHYRVSSKTEPDQVDQQRLWARIGRLEHEIDELHLRISAAVLRQRSERAIDENLIAALSERLAAGTALVEYAAAGDGLIAFVVGREGIREIVELGPVDRLRDDVYRFRQAAVPTRLEDVRMNFSNVKGTLETLYRRYFEPLEPFLASSQRIVAVPYQDLFHIPFHALHDGSGFLIEDLEFVYAPSASIYLDLCQKRDGARGDAANVVVGVDAPDIPWVRSEVEEFCEVFPGAVRIEGRSATKSEVARSVAGAEIIHLACHGLFRADNPLYSSLRLYDGPLMVRDCRNLDLRACRLAVLSACETGISKITDGEEALGLVRGFLSAGAANLVLSHWVVEDSATRRIMKRFYQLLNEGRSPSSALRGSQMELLEEMPHPFFWAPFYSLGA